MKRPTLSHLLRGLCLAAIGFQLTIGCPGSIDYQAIKKLTHQRIEPFASDDDFDDYVRALRDANRGGGGGLLGCADAEMSASPSAAPRDDGITNNQESGVDEGDIVKLAGDFLIVLRRGRLFSLRHQQGGEAALELVDTVDAYPEGSDLGSWYDEMLIDGSSIVVIGYSYEVSATEIELFEIDAEGRLHHRGTSFLRSNDYYSSRNYASRLVDGQLVLYMPANLFAGGWAPFDEDLRLPAQQHWQRNSLLDQWKPVIQKTEIYQPIQDTAYPTLHTLVQCEILDAAIDCRARGIIGPYARSFYVARDAVYVWVADDGNLAATVSDEAPEITAMLYRLPLDGASFTATRARGMPIDQFSFQQAGDELRVLSSGSGRGDAMDGPEYSHTDLALLRLPLDRFATEPASASNSHYTALPGVSSYSVQNRFVGDFLLYGGGNGWYRETTAPVPLHVVDLRDGVRHVELNPSHSVDRLDRLGDDAIVIGMSDDGLVFSTVALGDDPRLISQLTAPGATQGETRSHGFFFRPDPQGGGTIGLPIRTSGAGSNSLWSGSAYVTYLRVGRDLELRPLGQLAAHAQDNHDDHCQVSCMDWYGNARPIFLGQRVLALLGYELIEGQVQDDELSEVERVDFTP